MEEGRLDQRESDENGVASVTDLVIDYEEILVSCSLMSPIPARSNPVVES